MASRKIQTYQNKAKNLCTIYVVFDLDGECKFTKVKIIVIKEICSCSQDRICIIFIPGTWSFGHSRPRFLSSDWKHQLWSGWNPGCFNVRGQRDNCCQASSGWFIQYFYFCFFGESKLLLFTKCFSVIVDKATVVQWQCMDWQEIKMLAKLCEISCLIFWS